MPLNSPPSQTPSHSHSHSNALEHRLTVVETTQIERWRANREVQSETADRLSGHDRRLNLHEKAILAIGAVLQVLLQDKYPTLAALIKAALP
tara:strand:- start:123 stop:398 length:276 start_codon:yes stop_codon:yes gene_type:complete